MLIDLPFVRQHGETHCGAACLEMIYRKFGIDRDQDTIFEEHAEVRPRNMKERYIKTNRIALDAQNQGLHSQIFKARDIIATLRMCDTLGLPAILEQRMNLSNRREIGHFRIVAGLNGQSTFNVYDPVRQRPNVLTANELRLLSAEAKPEVVGNFIVVISDHKSQIDHCEACTQKIPSELPCPKCGSMRQFPFSQLLGCFGAQCAGRFADGLGCPACNGEGLSSTQERCAAS